MIDIRVWDTKNNIDLDKSKSIIDDVVISHTKSGFEVFISLKTRAFEHHGYGSTSGGGEPTTHSMQFEVGDVWHTVEYEILPEYDEHIMSRLVDTCKNQVTIYYIDNNLLMEKGVPFIDKYECPSQGMVRTLDSLGLDTF